METSNFSHFRFRQNNSSLNDLDTSNETSRDQTNQQLTVDRLLLIYLLPVIVLAGTVGNVASVVVLLRKRMRVVSVYLYLLLLAFADTTVLYTSAFKTWFRMVAGIEWLHLSDMACRFLTFIFLVSLHFSAWLVVLTTADRFIAVLFPLKTAVLCSLRRARIAASLLLLIIIFFDVHLLWNVRLQYIGKLVPPSLRGKLLLFLRPSGAPAE